MRKQSNSTEFDALVGKRLKSARKRLRMTQSQMAEKLDISEESYRRWEHGRNSLSISRLLLLHEKCGIRPDYLVLGEQGMDFAMEFSQFLNSCESEKEYHKRVRLILTELERRLVDKV